MAVFKGYRRNTPVVRQSDKCGSFLSAPKKLVNTKSAFRLPFIGKPDITTLLSWYSALLLLTACTLQVSVPFRFAHFSGPEVMPMTPAGLDTEFPTKSFIHRKIYLELLAAINSGRYAEGQRLPSEAQLVRQFHASRPTVTRALKELQHEGLVERRAGSGTFVRRARQLQGHLFGLIVPKLGETEIFDPICRELVRSAHDSGHAVIWSAAETTDVSERELEAICEQYVDRRVSGIFLAPVEVESRAAEINQRLADTLERARISVVLLDRDFYEYPRRSQFDLVGIDNRRVGFLATKHLVDLGCRRIAFLHRPNSAETVRSRIAGYRDALGAGSASRTELLCEGDPSDGAFVSKFVEKERPDAVVCANDLTAAHLMHQLDGLGIRIPEDLRIVGIDDVRYASLLRVPLTTVHQPCQDIGRNAVQAMVDRLANPRMPARDIRLQCQLVVRKSCGMGLNASSTAVNR
jgi:GntR family transcriptional regulator, arabinose operon transcriptional repressor